jgi:hypothetical protein
MGLFAAFICAVVGLLAALIARQHRKINDRRGDFASAVSIGFLSGAALLLVTPTFGLGLFVLGMCIAVGTLASSLILHV